MLLVPMLLVRHVRDQFEPENVPDKGDALHAGFLGGLLRRVEFDHDIAAVVGLKKDVGQTAKIHPSRAEFAERAVPCVAFHAFGITLNILEVHVVNMADMCPNGIHRIASPDLEVRRINAEADD